jgi:hypothetical protein
MCGLSRAKRNLNNNSCKSTEEGLYLRQASIKWGLNAPDDHPHTGAYLGAEGHVVIHEVLGVVEGQGRCPLLLHSGLLGGSQLRLQVTDALQQVGCK